MITRRWCARARSGVATAVRGRRATSQSIRIEAVAMSAPAISVPQANPGAGYRALQTEIDAAVARVLQSGWYILGQELRAFEAEFAAWLGADIAVGCGNGTD